MADSPTRASDAACPLSWLAAAVLAVTCPTLLAYNQPPSPTFFNQAIAFMGWGAWGMMLAAAPDGPAGRVGREGAVGRDSGLFALLAALALLVLAATAAPLWAALPWSLALSSIGALAATVVVLMLGAGLARRGLAAPAFHAFCVALLAAGVVGALIAFIQVFLPQWSGSLLIATASDTGRAAGNLRQPNHLSSLLLWALAALVWLVERERIDRAAAALLGVLMLAAMVLTASRTGAFGLLLFAVWGACDRALARRRLHFGLLLAPLVYLAFWGAFTFIRHLSGESFSGEGQLVRSDFSSSRFAIWHNTLALIARQPWTGVGWGEFNFAWTLTPFPDRPTAFFDHTHNLPLQLAAEIGVPLALLAIALFLWSLGRALLVAVRAAGDDPTLRVALRAAFMMVLVMALHSQLEYPLWYAYFLLPTAFAWGLCLGSGRTLAATTATATATAATVVAAPATATATATDEATFSTTGKASTAEKTAAPPRRPTAAGFTVRPAWIGSALLLVGGAAALYDYMRVVVIFSPGAGAAPLAVRIAAGRRSVLFGHHADYAEMTTESSTPQQVLAASHRAAHYLLDSRLMEAWAKALEASGDDARARYVAARLKEFDNEGNDQFFAPCSDDDEETQEEQGGPQEDEEADPADAVPETAEAPASAASPDGDKGDAGASGASGPQQTAPGPGPLPFQCLPPPSGLGFRDFR